MIKINSISSYKILLTLFVVLSLSPFVFPVMSSDVQPYAFIFALLLLALNIPLIIKNNKFSFLTLSILFFTLILYLLTPDAKNNMKLAYGYVSFAIVTLCSYCINRNSDEDYIKKIVFIVIAIWFVTGFYQTLFNRTFFAGLISNSRTTIERGVFGLASEPSFYGIQCFYFLFLTKLFSKNRLIMIAAIAIMAIFFAQSTLGVIFVVSYIALYVLDSKDTKLIIFALFAFFVVLYYFITKDGGSRLSFFINEFLSSDISTISDDESTTVRINSITNSWQAATNNLYVPQGFSKRYGSLIGDFILSWGFICVPYLFFILKCLGSTYSYKSIRILSYILFFLLLNSNLQISNPSFGFIIGFQLSRLEN